MFIHSVREIAETQKLSAATGLRPHFGIVADSFLAFPWAATVVNQGWAWQWFKSTCVVTGGDYMDIGSDVSTDIEQALMLAAAQQSVSTAIEASERTCFGV